MKSSNKNPCRPPSRAIAGLTLVELLVIIAVLGFFSAMAIPTLKNIISESLDATARSNAQNIAMVASVAEVMGTDVFKDVTSLETAVDRIVAGTDSSFSNASFAAGDLTEEAKLDAMRFLRFEQGIILYSADASKGAPSVSRTTASPLVSSQKSNF